MTRKTSSISSVTLIAAVLWVTSVTAWADPITQRDGAPMLFAASDQEAESAACPACPTCLDCASSRRTPSGSEPSSSARPWKPAPAEAALGVGFQANRGHLLSGGSVDFRLPIQLPYSVRPQISVGFFYNSNEGYFALPATLGLIRSFVLNGFLEGKSEVIAGVAAGLVFTNEGARGNELLLLAIPGWEVNLDWFTPFVQVPVGLRAGGLIAYPRVGIVFKL